MNSFSTNILILGKTGVGKSSLLNYLFGNQVAIAGAGKPVTGEGIHPFDPFPYNENLSIRIYDSWGLEPDKASKWKKLVEQEVQRNNEKSIQDWFHTIIYCIDAQRARIDQFEISDIITPLHKQGNNIIFALTKSDIASDVERQSVAAVLAKEYPDCLQVAVGSIPAKKLRNGKETRQFGREEVLEKICLNLRKNVVHKSLSRIVRKVAPQEFDEARKKCMSFFEEKAGWGIFVSYDSEFQGKICDYAKKAFRSAFEKIQRTMKEDFGYIDNLSAAALRNFTGYEVNSVLLRNVNQCLDKNALGNWENNFSNIVTAILFDRKDRAQIAVATFLDQTIDNLRKLLQVQVNRLRDEESKLQAHFEKQLGL